MSTNSNKKEHQQKKANSNSGASKKLSENTIKKRKAPSLPANLKK